jgi:lia operon protein LiaF
MTGNENSNESISKGHQWHQMCGGRNSSIFWGIFFIVVGLFWLGKNANWFPAELITMFWPLVLVILGVWVIGAAAIRKRNRN